MQYNYYLILIVISSLTSPKVSASEVKRFALFLHDFVKLQCRPTKVESFMNNKPDQNKIISEHLSKVNSNFKIFVDNLYSDQVKNDEQTLYLINLKHEKAVKILQMAKKTKKILSPRRWMLLYETSQNSKNFSEIVECNTTLSKYMNEIENLLKPVIIGFNTEVYVVLDNGMQFCVYLVHRNRQHLPIKWELYNTWDILQRFQLPYPRIPVAMRRRNLGGQPLVTTAVLLNNQSLRHMSDYMDREVDNLSKVVYYMALHLFEWMNATGIFNTTASWGYQQPDGTYDGVIRELQDGRSEFSGTVLIQRKDRMFAVEYVLPPAELSLDFIFRKPALASITNIYVLPFTQAVWLATVVLIFILSAALIIASFWEIKINENSNQSKLKILNRISEAVLDVLSCVFQQGTANDPISVTSRQILLLCLMTFMFLYTAYAANVVALLQSTTNDINSVKALLDSPLQCGAHDVLYNRVIFKNENRPLHRAFWMKKGLPQGERFFLSVEDGIRRVRQGLFAFHVEPTAGFDMIQKTFLEHEKCNIGSIKYTDFKTPYFGVARNSEIKEALRVGVIRIIESGVQDRTNRRITARFPSCLVGAGVFTAVDILDVAPAFKCLLAVYMLALLIFGAEILVHRKSVSANYGSLNRSLEITYDPHKEGTETPSLISVVN